MVQEQTDGGRAETQKKDGEGEGRYKRTDRERNDEEEVNLVIDSPAFYGPPPARVVTVAIAITPRGPGCWLRDASERANAARNREPRLIKRRRAIVNNPPRLVIKDRAGISRSVSRLLAPSRPIGVRRFSEAACITPSGLTRS